MSTLINPWADVLHWTLAAAYPLALVYAVVSDVRRLTIPNRASIIIAVTFLPAALFAGLAPSAIAIHYAVGAGLLGLGFFAFSYNLMGGGDVKLLAAAGIWAGIGQLGPFLILVAVLGGVLAVIVLAAHKLRKTTPFSAALGRPIPYGVAIGIAAIYLFAENPALPEAWVRLLG